MTSQPNGKPETEASQEAGVSEQRPVEPHPECTGCLVGEANACANRPHPCDYRVEVL